MENMLNSWKHGKISSYAENISYCLDVYNLAQKLANSANCQDYQSGMTEESCPR